MAFMKKERLKNKKITATIRVCNLTIAQSIALEDMMATWVQLGNAGASRWTSFFADGDGNFHPQILYNGHTPKKTHFLEEEDTWIGSDYKIDFDSIGWKIHDDDSIRVLEIKRSRLLPVVWGTFKFLIRCWIKNMKMKIKLNKIKKEKQKCAKIPVSEAPCEQPEPPEKSYSDQPI
jgi:hypothetical protein